jgi:glycosyltransferase involved in cell wall biosynthesis
MMGAVSVPVERIEDRGKRSCAHRGGERIGKVWRRGVLAPALLSPAAPGKRHAAALLVANARTQQALPAVTRDVPVVRLVENGVDLSRFSARQQTKVDRERVRFAFVGRLVDWKGIDLLLEAPAMTTSAPVIELEVFGAGPEHASLNAQAERLGLSDRVTFHGFVPQEQTAQRLAQLDGLVLPSLYECGGAVVLEAMASALPVIATRWGGPADYLDDSCGILIDPSSREHVVDSLARAMSALAVDPFLRERMGAAGRLKVEREYDWVSKLDQILSIYASVQSSSLRARAGGRNDPKKRASAGGSLAAVG